MFTNYNKNFFSLFWGYKFQLIIFYALLAAVVASPVPQSDYKSSPSKPTESYVSF